MRTPLLGTLKWLTPWTTLKRLSVHCGLLRPVFCVIVDQSTVSRKDTIDAIKVLITRLEIATAAVTASGPQNTYNNYSRNRQVGPGMQMS